MSKQKLNEYFEGQDCTCCARSENECACGADWTPKEVYALRVRVAELERYNIALASESHAKQVRIAELEEELTKSTDQNDLVLDEFVRVKCLTDNTEIHQLCERAHVRMRQNVSVIDRNHELETKVKELEQENKKLRERNRKLDVDLLRGLFYAPSSPVSAKKAQEIEVWYGKFKQVQLANKGGAE